MGGAWSCFYTDACLSPSCGEDGGPAMKPGLIHVTVNYMGSVTETSKDTLYVGAFPAGMPKEGVPQAFFVEPSPMFPFMGTLVLEPGAYDLIAILDIGSNDNPDNLGPEDLERALSAPIEIKGGDEHAADILIMDK
jgi:hypothetical protein